LLTCDASQNFVPRSFQREQNGIEPLGSARRLTVGTLLLQESFNRNQELAMQAIVEKVIRAFSVKHPVSDDETKPAQQATELAAKLLENYKKQLARRTLRAYRG
jgi:hypothetical protein